MLPRRAADVRQSILTSRWLPAALALLLLLSTRLSSAHSTTVEHDFHIVHNVDNRSKYRESKNPLLIVVGFLQLVYYLMFMHDFFLISFIDLERYRLKVKS